MKAYKALSVHNNRYFSSNPCHIDIGRYINKKKLLSFEPWKILEYFPDKWVSAKRNAPVKDLFVFKDTKYLNAAGGDEFWLVEVPDLTPHPLAGKTCHGDPHDGYILYGSYITSKVKLIERITWVV